MSETKEETWNISDNTCYCDESCDNVASSEKVCGKSQVLDGALILCKACQCLLDDIETYRYWKQKQTKYPFFQDVLGNVIAFTGTFKTNPKGFNKPHEQMKYTLNEYETVLNKCSDDWMIVPELTKENRIHYHGWLYVKDKIAYSKKLYPFFQTNGFSCLKPIKDFENFIRWNHYCWKEVEQNSIKFSPNTKSIDIVFWGRDKTSLSRKKVKPEKLKLLNLPDFFENLSFKIPFN